MMRDAGGYVLALLLVGGALGLLFWYTLAFILRWVG
jgi:hypothetical protein